MKKYNPIIIVAGEPNSIFLEIFFKTINSTKFKSPLILIASKKLLLLQMKFLNFKKKIKIIDIENIKDLNLDNKTINLINIDYDTKKAFEKISSKSNSYIEKSFDKAFKIIKKGYSNKFINGPISKKSFLNKKFPGITEYISNKFSVKKNAMLIFNKNLSVCPLTTHLPISKVTKNINKKSIYDKAYLIKQFYKKYLNLNPKIAILGLNPHCETTSKVNEEKTIIEPAIKNLKKKRL